LTCCIVGVRSRICLTVKVEECELELPEDVDPVMMVGEEREKLPAVEEPSQEIKRAARPRRKLSGEAN
jgi:hypothetical protein